MSVAGTCYCGAVHIAVAGDIGGGVLCHCRTCQKLHSHNSYNLQSTVANVTVTKGTPKVYVDSSSDSGNVIHRNFCGDCGSALFSIPDGMPGVCFVKVGCLENAASIKPVAEIYIDTAMPHSVLSKAVHGTKHFEGMMAKEV